MIKNLLLRFNNVCSTSENNPDPELRTRYYRSNKNTLFVSLENILRNRKGSKIMDASKERGEIACELSSPFPAFLIATVVTVRPFETAVDFTLSTERSAIFMNYPALRKEAIGIYDEIGRKHTFIGEGKNAQ